MVWEERHIESRMKKSLAHQFGATEGENLWSHYVRAREKLCKYIYGQIPGTLPQYTDHSQPHIENVLDNVAQLLGPELPKKGHDHLNAADGYCLCLSVLFHDVGMVFGRRDHERNIVQVYNWVRKGEPKLSQERHIVMRAAGAHSGKTETGSRDTIGDLSPTDHFKGECVHLQEIAAILRFADELAEGPQRTSAFMKDAFGYSKQASIHHRYAESTEIHIDRKQGRIALTYDIEIDTNKRKQDELLNEMEELLNYVFQRIIKLDQERQYASYYSQVLRPFLATSIHFNYWIDGERAPLDLDNLVLTGKCVPGDRAIDLNERDPEYDVRKICNKMEKLLQKEEADE